MTRRHVLQPVRHFGARALFALASVVLSLSVMASPAALAQDDAYRPPASDVYDGDGAGTGPSSGETYEPVGPRRDTGDGGGYGEPYSAPDERRTERYEDVPPEDNGGPPDSESRGYYSQNEIVKAGHGFFGSVSSGLASAIEWAFKNSGRPNGYILGQDAGGALVAGLRYGEGTLHTKDAGTHRVYWQGPTVGYDAGAEGSKVMTLVYNMRSPDEIYRRFAGVQGAAYLVGGVSAQVQKAGSVTMVPIRAGVGLRLGANVGYLKYTRSPTWNPF